MLRDRGTIKWVSMMLPEHVKLLREYQESLDKVEKPVLDEQKYQEFDEVICEAMENNRPLQFTYFQKGELKKLTGCIHYVDVLQRELRILSDTSQTFILKLDDMVDIEYDSNLFYNDDNGSEVI
ncbi:YolD-like family protein [Bacillus sp. WMMC1349]|uniref:YolD-like family protein n=1 Tax=Bacillus sp. WMMC1349 TaxID=2736254 RepID=UPI0015542280|nr:YolD-like family protein [Bacillus sp. WMMC1349]NPC93181.1 YolD-like family protein [Bacillus sp. WMMC1349]